jgi:hypothetical protein
MKKINIILIILISSFNFAMGQTNDSITMKKVVGGYHFFQGEERLTVNQLVKAMKTNNEAYSLVKSAQSNNTIASVIGGVGGFMVGWTLGTALGGGEPNWAVAGVGAGLIVVSIPISHSFNKKVKKAVETYNRGFQTSSFWDDNKLNLSLKGNGIGLRLSF